MVNASTPLARYAVALLAVAAAIAVRALLSPWLGTAFPLATMFSAVAFVVWAAGRGPAMLTAFVGWFAAGLVFRGTISFLSGGFTEIVGFAVYIVSCASIVVLGEAMRAAQRKLEVQQRHLSDANLALESKVEAQSLLAAIVASSEDAIVSKTLDGIITTWNKGAERVFGWRADEAIGRSIHLIVPPELRDHEREILETLRRGERIDHLDVERLRKDGTRVHVSATISPVYDRHGHIIGASKTARDITLRKAWQDSLVSSEEAQRLLVGLHDATRGLQDPATVMLEIVTRVGLHFDVTRCAYGEVDANQKEVTLARGYTRGVPGVEGRYLLDAFGPPLADQLRAGQTVTIPDVRTSPLTNTPAALETYAGMHIVSMVCVPLVRAGQLVAFLGMSDSQARNWTAQEANLLEQVAERTLFAVESARAAAALRENRDVLQLAMRTARMGAWSRNLVLDTVWLSPECIEIFGFHADDSRYDPARLFGLLKAEDRERLPRLVNEALAARRDYAIEFEFRHATTGEWRVMEARGRAMYTADGKPTMLFGLAIDITDRRRAVDALQDADRRKDEFLATLAHELRNPLAPIKSGLHVLRVATDASQSAAALEIMERQVSQMVRLVDDLLDIARITTGKVEVRSEPLDLATAIKDAAETSAPALGGRPLTIVPAPEPVLVNGDRTRLAQVFANLLNNSAKYSEPGQPVTILCSREGGDAVVRVRDQGMGIHPEMLPRVFEMFRQADRSGSQSRGGLGIGLTLVKRIVETHGGTVTARSEGLGRGSEFEVRLPAIEAARDEPTRREDQTDGPATTKRRILIVDDNGDAAESLAMLLAINGHQTRMAHDGHEAVQQAERFNPHVVFLDIGMPILDGYETARLIRQQPWGKDMMLVALTGWGQTEDRRRSRDAGFNHHLVKPADPAALMNLLESLGQDEAESPGVR